MTSIQWLLRKFYNIVNLSYLSLSREMEFHADSIAAGLTGYEPLKNALLRMNFASEAYQYVIDYYSEKVNLNIVSPNIYPEQLFLMNFNAEKHKLKFNGLFPQITSEDYNKYNKSKLVISDQWSSHPSTEERIERMKSHSLNSETDDFKPAISLFEDPDMIMEQVTRHLFRNVEYNDATIFNSIENFEDRVAGEYAQSTFPSFYNGYYDNKNPLIITGEISGSNEPIDENTLFSQDKVDLVYTKISLDQDIQTLQYIHNGEIKVKSFDYDGIRYQQKDSAALVKKLNEKQSEIIKTLSLNDRDIYNYFHTVEAANSSKPKLKELYDKFFIIDKEYAINAQLHHEISYSLNFLNERTPYAQIRQNFYKISPQEDEMKSKLNEMLNNPDYSQFLDPSKRERLQLYLSQKWPYFIGEEYMSDNLDLLFESLGMFIQLTYSYLIYRKKLLLEYQVTLVKAVTIV